METIIPKTSTVFSSLLRADFTTQWRNRRSFVLILIVPIIILFSWKGLVPMIGGAAVLSNCLTVGLMAIGLMGYSNSIARDREKGIFQRLRVAPVPSWSIMTSRLTVQLIMISLLNLLVFIAGNQLDQITLSPEGYILAFIAAFVGGAVYLSLGQAIVGLIKNPETVNSTTRLVYLVFMMTGMIGVFTKEESKFEIAYKQFVHWSPYGTVQTILAASMDPSKWTNDTSVALLVTVGYAVVLAGVGIKKFQWK